MDRESGVGYPEEVSPEKSKRDENNEYVRNSFEREGSVPISEKEDFSTDSDDEKYYGSEKHKQETPRESSVTDPMINEEEKLRNRNVHRSQHVTDDSFIKDENHKQFRNIKECGNKAESVGYDDHNGNFIQKVTDMLPKYFKEWSILKVVILIAIILFFIYFCYYKSPVETILKSPVDQFQSLVKLISKDFPNQDRKIWKSMFGLIKNVNESNPKRPVSFILMHTRNNKEVAECLAFRMARATQTFFGTPDIVEVTSNSIMDYTDNELITEYNDILQNKGVMIVYNLDQIPGLVAQSFHSFCDVYNPLVRRAVFIFTLDSTMLNDNNIKPNEKATQIMKTLWTSTLDDYKLNPLITRLTENVLEIKPEERVTCDS